LIGASLLLLCLGIITLLLTFTKKASAKASKSSVEEPRVAPSALLEAEELFNRADGGVPQGDSAISTIQPTETIFTEDTNSDEAANLTDIIPHGFEHEAESELIEGISEFEGQENTLKKALGIDDSEIADTTVQTVNDAPASEVNAIDEPQPREAQESIEGIAVQVKTRMTQVEIKEDPKFLFGDWWVDEKGLFIDMRLISISGRKAQKILRKLPLNTLLDYHINNRNDAIEIVHNKVVIGVVPELYLHSLLMYIQGIETIKAESIVKKGRVVVQCTVKVRFGDDLRERLQKKLQQKTWQ
jgi:hypothetical protein